MRGSQLSIVHQLGCCPAERKLKLVVQLPPEMHRPWLRLPLWSALPASHIQPSAAYCWLDVIAVFFQMQLVITKRVDNASHHCNSRCKVSPASPARTVSHLYAWQQGAYHPGFAKLPSSAKRRIAVAVEPQSLRLR